MKKQQTKKQFIARGLLLILVIALGINTVLAAPEEQWPNTTSPVPQIVNNDPGTNQQTWPRITRASDGNYIISWFDDRNSGDLYVQKVSATDGSKLWNSGNDVAVSTNTNFIPEQNVWRYNNHAIVADNSGGAFVIWDTSDNPNTLSDIYAQHFNSSGVAQWAANGVKIEADSTAATQFEHVPFVVSDGSGFFMAWSAMDSGFANMTAYAARIDSSGGIDATWNSGNVLTLPSGSYSYNSVTGIISDGSGGVIVSYNSTDMGANGDAIGARISSTGVLDTNWNSGNGVVFDDAGDAAATSAFPTKIRITSDGSGGMLGAYLTSTNVLKVQGINAAGTLKFGSATVISNNTRASNIHITSDGAGGAIIAWTYTTTPDIRTQRINSSGAIQWPDGAPAVEGNLLVSGQAFATNYLGTPIVPGSAIIGYISDVSETPSGTKINNTGTEQWGAGGTNMGGGSFFNIGVDVVSDGNGGAAFAWSAYNVGNIEIFTQYIQDPPPGPAPDAVTDLAATSGAASATLTWTEPNDNGSAITGYTVEYGTVSSGLFDMTCADASCTDATAGATVPGLSNFIEYQFRVIATNANGDSGPSNTATTTPTGCSPMADNDDSGGPTVSEGCFGVTVTAGTISLEDIPDTFAFPSKFSSTLPQDSFSNDNAATSTIDVITGPGDVLTVADYRNAGGFDLTITTSDFIGPSANIDLENLYVVSTCPDLNDLDPDLYGSPVNCTSATGVEFADGSSNMANMDQTDTVHSDNATGTATNSTELDALRNAYLNDGASFDADLDDTPDIVTLMESTTARVARVSQTLGFYIGIPASQASGDYNVKFTIDLIPN